MRNDKHSGHSTTQAIIQPKYFKYLIFIVLSLTGFLYLRVFENGFTNWDDKMYILLNPYLKSLSFENLKNIFTVYYGGNYHPLTLVSLAIDHQIGGAQPWPYQLTNIFLHLANTYLVYIITKKLLQSHFINPADYAFVPLVTSALFGIHTFQVESVAWMSERKNVLYAFFFLLSIYFYIIYIGRKTIKVYFLSLVLFLFSLLSKGTAVPLAICIVCIDYFAGRKLLSKKVIFEKLPYLLLSIVFGIVAIAAQRSSEAIWQSDNFYLSERIAVASYGFIVYLAKLLYPFHLSAYYPFPVTPGALLPFEYYGCIVLAIIIFFVLWKYFRKNKIIMFGSLFFLANISIVLQLLPVGRGVMADRYVYLAGIGFFFIIGYYFNKFIITGSRYRNILFTLIALYCLILAVKTYNRISIWKDSVTLWSDSLKNFRENNDQGYLNRGNIYYENGAYDKALQDYYKVLEINKRSSGAYIGLGLIKRLNNDIVGAMNDFNNAILYYPTYEGYINRAALKMVLKDFSGALEDLESAYKKNPYKQDVYTNKGFVFLQTGKYYEAWENFTKAIEIGPDNSGAYLGRGRTRQALNDFQGALDDLNKSLLFSQTCEAYLSRADLKMAIKDFEGARIDLDRASQLQPFKPEIYINKGMLELNLGNVKGAFQAYNKAVEVSPNNYQPYLYRAIAKMSLKDFRGAKADLDTSLQLNPDAMTLYYRGLANRQIGNKDAACKDFKQSALSGNANARKEVEKGCR